MDKMRMESVDMTAQNIEKIGALFPNCITETVDENGKAKKAINFELLKQMLSGDVLDGEEAYELTWVGKKAAVVGANRPSRKTLRPCKENSVNWDTTENLYIEGDNLEVLKLLQESYLNSVDVNMTDVYYSADEYSQDMLSLFESNIKADRTDLDLLFGCLLEWGLPLSLPYTSEQIEGCTVHTYNDGDLIACFDEDIPDSVIKTIAKK